jgi:hypothetical protein
MFGCFRLGARIWDLKRRGEDIVSERYTTTSGKRVAKYFLQTNKTVPLQSKATT